MFSLRQKREIADKIQQILRQTQHPELPDGEISFHLHVDGAKEWSWADIKNNGAVATPSINPGNESKGQKEGKIMAEGYQGNVTTYRPVHHCANLLPYVMHKPTKVGKGVTCGHKCQCGLDRQLKELYANECNLWASLDKIKDMKNIPGFPFNSPHLQSAVDIAHNTLCCFINHAEYKIDPNPTAEGEVDDA